MTLSVVEGDLPDDAKTFDALDWIDENVPRDVDGFVARFRQGRQGKDIHVEYRE